jgi:hypothetical protein
MKGQTGKKKLRTIGRHVIVDLPGLGAYNIEAKVDTGAFRTVIHCESCRIIQEHGKPVLEGIFNLDGKGEKVIRFTRFFEKDFKSSFGEREKRYCVPTVIRIGKKRIKSSVSFTDRSDMRFQVLIGRKTILRKFLVDVSRKFV